MVSYCPAPPGLTRENTAGLAYPECVSIGGGNPSSRGVKGEKGRGGTKVGIRRELEKGVSLRFFPLAVIDYLW